MHVTFQKNLSDRKRICKSINPVLALENVKIKDESSIMHPVIVVNKRSFVKQSQALLDVNYCTITETGRSYFIDDITIQHDGTVAYSLTCDVLYTYKDKLLTTTVLAIRAETAGRSLYTDPEYPIRSNKIYTFKKIGKLPDEVDEHNHNYYLTVAGG